MSVVSVREELRKAQNLFLQNLGSDGYLSRYWTDNDYMHFLRLFSSRIIMYREIILTYLLCMPFHNSCRVPKYKAINCIVRDIH